jgi:hypothetical protein
LIVDAQVLPGKGALQRIAKELAQIRDRDEPCRTCSFRHSARISFFILNGTQRLKFTPLGVKIP